jgi:competence CoiA-like predicted nuclease
MIKIQLAPADEVDSGPWALPDGIVMALIGAIAYFGVTYYLDSIREETAKTTAQAEQWKLDYKKQEPRIQQFQTLNSDVDMLNRRIEAIKKISVSKISRFFSVLFLDNMQTVRPEGLWFSKFTLSDDGKFQVIGGTTDNLLLAEFMLTMRESMNVTTVNTDLRTQVGYSNIQLIKSNLSRTSDSVFKDVTNYIQYELRGTFAEKVPSPDMRTPTPVISARSPFWSADQSLE